MIKIASENFIKLAEEEMQKAIAVYDQAKESLFQAYKNKHNKPEASYSASKHESLKPGGVSFHYWECLKDKAIKKGNHGLLLSIASFFNAVMEEGNKAEAPTSKAKSSPFGGANKHSDIAKYIESNPEFARQMQDIGLSPEADIAGEIK
jgi:hypothetical protein